MNDFEKRKCLEVTNKMLHMDLCKPFKEKVDPIRDGAPNYNEIVKHPMDLSTIRRNLMANELKGMDEWAAAVNLVWHNAMLFNGEGTLIHLIAKEMKEWFDKKYSKMPRTKDEEWMTLLRKSTKKMMYLSQHPPATIVPMKTTETESTGTVIETRGKCSAVKEETA